MYRPSCRFCATTVRSRFFSFLFIVGAGMDALFSDNGHMNCLSLIFARCPRCKERNQRHERLAGRWKNLAKVTGFSLKRERPRSRFLGSPFSVCLSAWKVLGRRKWGGWECLEGRRPKGIPILPRREAPAAASPACRRCRSRSLLQFAKRSAFQLDHVAVVE